MPSGFQRRIKRYQTGLKNRAMPGGIGKKARQRLKSFPPRAMRIQEKNIQKQVNAITKEWKTVTQKLRILQTNQMEIRLDKWGLHHPLKREAIIRGAFAARKEYNKLYSDRSEVMDKLGRAEHAIELLEKKNWGADDYKTARLIKIPLQRNQIKKWILERKLAEAILNSIEKEMLDVFHEPPPAIKNSVGEKSAKGIWESIREIVMEKI